MEKVKKILKIILIIFAIIICVFNVVLIIKAHNNKGELPDFFGYTPCMIISGSMEPKIPVNSIIVTKKVDKNKIEVGDIVSYIPKNESKLVTHRVVKMTYLPSNYTDNKTGNGHDILYEIKGDNNKHSDEYLISYSQIKGKYLFTIPLLGKIVSLLKTPIGVGALFLLMITAYVIYYIKTR